MTEQTSPPTTTDRKVKTQRPQNVRAKQPGRVRVVWEIGAVGPPHLLLVYTTPAKKTKLLLADSTFLLPPEKEVRFVRGEWVVGWVGEH